MGFLLAFALGFLAGYLFAQYKPPASSTLPPAEEDEFNVTVVGEAEYQDTLEVICGGVKRKSVNKRTVAALVPEDSNPYDENAVRVEIDGRAVGYLSHWNARTYRQLLEETEGLEVPTTCEALIRGGWYRSKRDRGDFSVKLKMPAL